MKEKTLLILGGSRYIVPVIDAAHAMGHRVVTMDYLPDNYAHRFSDSYVNVSIVDKEAVLKAARNLGVNGIMSFAADPGVIAAAYTAEALGLPFQSSYETASILQDKGRFRSFLQDNGFNCPSLFVFKSAIEASASAEAITYPVIVKPTDSAGSKGCSRVNGPEGIVGAVEYALSFSVSGTCIVEQFIEKAFPSSDSDCFTIDGRFECISFTAQLFDKEAENPYTPAAYMMPCGMPQSATSQIAFDLQRLSDLLNLRSGVYNVETRTGIDGLPYIMEVSPRGGGNRLCEMLRYASGVDLIRASVKAALNEEPEDVHMPTIDGFWYQEILHSAHGGTFQRVEFESKFEQDHVCDEQLWIDSGTRVESFSAANHAFGTVFLRFESQEELDDFRANKNEVMRVVVE